MLQYQQLGKYCYLLINEEDTDGWGEEDNESVQTVENRPHTWPTFIPPSSHHFYDFMSPVENTYKTN